MTKVITVLLSLSVLLGVSLSAGEATAACVSGKVEFWWELGNYCSEAPPGGGEVGDVADCSGWIYTDASQDDWKPMKEVVVELRVKDSSTVLANADVDSNGNFSACYQGTRTEIDVKFFPEHKSGAFKIQTSSGGRWTFHCNDRPGSGSIGTCRFGSDDSPNAVASVYYSAYAFYKNVAVQMDRVRESFTNVRVRMDTGENKTNGYDKIVKIMGSPDAEFGFHFVGHELGHVLEHLASRDHYLGPNSDYKKSGHDYDACGGNNTWTFSSSDECRDAIDHEGKATFFGAMSRMLHDAEYPCESTAGRAEPCHIGSQHFDLEDNFCPNSGRDQVKQVVQYLWDTFDPSKSTDRDDYDEILHTYPDSRDNHGKAENWCCAVACWKCDHDDKNIKDFNKHFESVTGKDGDDLISNHCLN